MGLPGLRTHRKFRRLVLLLRIPEAHVLGHLQMLWETSWDHLTHEVGDVTDVELAAGWAGEAGALAPALVACGGDRPGFIEQVEDGRFIVHDWAEHAPSWVKKKLKLRGELAAEGKTISDVKRMAGQKGAAARWSQKDGILPSDHGKRDGICHPADGKRMANDGRPCPSPPLPSLPLEQEEAKASSSPSMADQVIAIWNEATAEKLPKAKATPTRTKAIRTLLKESGWLDDFKAACSYVAASAFHLGQNDRGWVATLDYLLQPGKATELAEKSAAPRTLPPSTGAPNGRPSAHHHRSATDAAYIQQLDQRDAQRPAAAAPDPDPDLQRMFG